MAGRWLTPDNNNSGVIVCRLVQLPHFCFPAFNGAMQELSDPDNWEEFGNTTPDEMAGYFDEMYIAMSDTSCP